MLASDCSNAQNPPSVADRYFQIWQAHNTSSLSRVFAKNVQYVILPRERILRGLPEVTQYWERNARRQRDLALTWSILGRHDRFFVTSFSARFFDAEELRVEHVTGVITMIENKHNLISLLIEVYDKLEEARGVSAK